MTTKRLIIGFTFCALLACNSRQSQENADKTNSGDSSKIKGIFNENEELYIVNKINEDSIDSEGKTWHWVEMKNSKNEIFSSELALNIGDSVWVGRDASGKQYVVMKNKKTE